MALETELETFRSKLRELKGEHEGKFALIRGAQVVDVFTSYEDAIKGGVFAVRPGTVSGQTDPDGGTDRIHPRGDF